MSVLYIAGPMTGLPEFNVPAFNAAELRLRALGYDTLNPARHGASPDMTWADYMRIDLRDVLVADGICILPGWKNSRGASLEVHVANALGVPVRTEDEWTAQAAS